MNTKCYSCYHSVVCGLKDLCEDADQCKQYISHKEIGSIRELNERLEKRIKILESEIQAADYCISDIEDALDRGNDNDWARSAISSYKDYIYSLND